MQSRHPAFPLSWEDWLRVKRQLIPVSTADETHIKSTGRILQNCIEKGIVMAE